MVVQAGETELPKPFSKRAGERLAANGCLRCIDDTVDAVLKTSSRKTTRQLFCCVNHTFNSGGPLAKIAIAKLLLGLV
ncbi:hypothetical protein O9993_09620 [Vibrio lentus]|nr:hypothetical protein [Vibrio lentus]